MAEKLYYSMGEMAEMFDVKPSLLRHWETQFGVLKPKRNKKGNRLYTPADVEHLKLIYHLVKEQGMTLEGARKALKQSRNTEGVSRDMELLERLQRVRAMLVEVREELKAGEGELVEEQAVAQTAPRAPRRKPVVKIEEQAVEAAVEGAEETPGASKPVRRRKKKGEAEHKELFAFYEQSLF